jgi:hypothetical protein
MQNGGSDFATGFKRLSPTKGGPLSNRPHRPTINRNIRRGFGEPLGVLLVHYY